MMLKTAANGVLVHYWREDDPMVDDVINRNYCIAQRGGKEVRCSMLNKLELIVFLAGNRTKRTASL